MEEGKEYDQNILFEKIVLKFKFYGNFYILSLTFVTCDVVMYSSNVVCFLAY